MLCRLKAVSTEASLTKWPWGIIQVISGLVEEKLSVCMRRILVNVTLEKECLVSLFDDFRIPVEPTRHPEQIHP